MAPRTVTRQSLKDQIRDNLIERMLDGTLPAGERLKELQLAQEFGTSQAPVREAIRCLETLGYVEHVPHVGAMVRTYSRPEMEEAYQIREALELHALRIVALPDAPLADELASQLATMHRAARQDDLRTFTRADNDFHLHMVAAAGNGQMIAIWESLKMQMQVMATLVEAAMPVDVLLALHPPIVEAVRSSDGAGARQALHHHYNEVRRYWQQAGQAHSG